MVRRAGKVRSNRLAALAAAVTLSLAPIAVAADDRGPATVYGTAEERPGARFANWAGVDVLSGSWSAYAGTSYALDGSLAEPGWRLRLNGGIGRYHYRRNIIGPEGPERRRFTGNNVFTDVLVGYQFQWDQTTVKLFAGGNWEEQFIDPFDARARAQDTAFGAKVAAEVWHWFSPKHWGALNATYATTFDTYKLEGRIGYRLTAEFDVGMEARIEGNVDYDAGRDGAQATLWLDQTGITAAAGLSGDQDMTTSPYATIGVFVRY